MPDLDFCNAEGNATERKNRGANGSASENAKNSVAGAAGRTNEEISRRNEIVNAMKTSRKESRRSGTANGTASWTARMNTTDPCLDARGGGMVGKRKSVTYWVSALIFAFDRPRHHDRIHPALFSRVAEEIRCFERVVDL